MFPELAAIMSEQRYKDAAAVAIATISYPDVHCSWVDYNEITAVKATVTTPLIVVAITYTDVCIDVKVGDRWCYTITSR